MEKTMKYNCLKLFLKLCQINFTALLFCLMNGNMMYMLPLPVGQMRKYHFKVYKENRSFRSCILFLHDTVCNISLCYIIESPQFQFRVLVASYV